MSNERENLEREALYRDAWKWLETKDGKTEFRVLPGGGVQCLVTVGDQTREASAGVDTSDSRRDVFIHAVDELQNS